MELRAPFPWFGGKRRAAHFVWPRLGNVPNYVEPFAGSLAVLLERPHPPKLETVNDRDAYLANFWRAIARDPEAVAVFADWPVNEADLHARHRWLVGQEEFRCRMLDDPDFFDVKIAGWWVWGLSQWIGSGWCSRPQWSGDNGTGGHRRGIRTDKHLTRPDLSSAGRGIHKRPHLASLGLGVHRKRPHLCARSGSGVHRQLPALYGNKGFTHAANALRCGWQIWRTGCAPCVFVAETGRESSALVSPGGSADRC